MILPLLMEDTKGFSISIITVTVAIFGAILAYRAFTINRRNYFESIKPDIIPEDWGRERQTFSNDLSMDTIHIRRLRNVGRGIALNVRSFGGHTRHENRPAIFMPTFIGSDIPAGE